MTMRITHVVILFLSLSLAACATYFDDAYAADKRGNYIEAVRLYRLAAEQGDAYAQNNLGAMYQFGTGVEKNYVMAYVYYDLAYQNGDAGSAIEIKALNNRKNLSLYMSKTDIELAQQQSKAILMAQSQRKLSTAQAAARKSCNTASFFQALGAMASSDSRYLGSAIAQGAGAGANASSQC